MTTTTRTKEAMLDTMMELNKRNETNKEGKKKAVAYFKNAQKVGNKVYLDIPLEMLKVDHETYQRPVRNHVRKLAMNWDENKCEALVVNYRNDGYFYIVDGQHRFEAKKMKSTMDENGNYDGSLVCSVFVGLTVKEEAELFYFRNVDTMKPDPYDTYKANICRGEYIDTAIQDVCDCYGIKVVKSKAHHTLKSVTTARSVVKGNGKEALHYIFNIIEQSGWGCFDDAYCSSVMRGLWKVYQACANDRTLAHNRLVDFFKVYKLDEVKALASINYPTLKGEKLYALMNDVAKGKFIQNNVVKLEQAM